MKGNLGEYDRNQFRNTLILILMSLATTMIWLSITLSQELMDNEEWHSSFKAVVPRLWKHLKEKMKESSLVNSS